MASNARFSAMNAPLALIGVAMTHGHAASCSTIIPATDVL